MGRISLYWGKIVLAVRRGQFWRRLIRFFYRRTLEPILFAAEIRRRYRALAPSDRSLDVASGFSDHRLSGQQLRAGREALGRIMAAYQRSCRAAQDAALPFRPRGLWKEWIADHYGELIAALNSERVERVERCLENFCRARFSVGLGASFENAQAYTRNERHKRYVQAVWCDYRDTLRKQGVDLGIVNFPLVGNPAGIGLNGSIIQIDTFRHVAAAAEINSLLSSVAGPTIVEIGGGYGGLAYQTLTLRTGQPARYLIFDLPEVAAISAYFMLLAFPERRIRLFGEGPVATDDGAEYNIGIFPHFCTADLTDLSVDLVYNSCSFSEMDRATSAEYVRIINRVTRGFLVHVNHELRFEFLREDGSTSQNLIGSEILPDLANFELKSKVPRRFNLPEDIFARAEAYEYVYQRRIETNGTANPTHVT
jgi:putative sugar O-methyltransferase